jgi:hypothetical protein
MSNGERAERAALLGIALAGAISVAVSSDRFDLWDTIVGITLVLILLTYDTRKPTQQIERYAFGAVYALCGLLIFGILLEYVASTLSWRGDLLALILWLVASFVIAMVRS